MTAHLGLCNRCADCGRIAGGYGPAARRTRDHPAKASSSRPVLEGDIQRSGDGCILPVKGGARRIHLSIPLENANRNPRFTPRGILPRPFHSI